MFRFNHYHQGAYYLSFAKVIAIKMNHIAAFVNNNFSLVFL
jgi:hypothetical protein